MMSRLLLGRCLSALATALIPTTLTLAVLRAGGDGGALGIVLASELVPLLVLLPVGGVVADRVRPERLALAADLTRCLSQAAIAAELLLGADRLLDLALLSAVAGAAIAFGSPAVPRLVIAVVPAPDRLRMNARIGVATSLSTVAAPALAGTVTVAAGPGWAAGLTAVLFACSAVTLGGVRTSGDGAGARRAFLADLAGGWREVRTRPWFLAAVLGHGVWHFVAGLFLTLGPVMVVRHLGGGEAGWTLIVQGGTVGMVLGVFVAPRLPIGRPLGAFAVPRLPIRRPLGAAPPLPIRRQLAVVRAGAAAYLLPMVALAVGAPVPVLAGAYFVAMFGLGLLSPLWETVVAEQVPEGALGRVRSFDQLISFASRPFGLAVAAPLALTGAVLVAAANLVAIAWQPAAPGQGPEPVRPARPRVRRRR
ncbi:MFS transporter [[Actinomadura] parvosata]|uniref:MFS transporter n=1 Tax=[Actinomadura] parvosata TaxID=1955412 RepID=UPI00406C58C7